MSGYDSIRPIPVVVQPFPLEQWLLALFFAINKKDPKEVMQEERDGLTAILRLV